MVSFDFVTDDELRSSLEADAKELDSCYAAKAWKAVHVLGGSIIEAILIDHLASSKDSKLSQAALAKKDLGSLITLCTEQGILSEKAAQLSTIVRSYRNLIHPGRVVRLNEQVDEQSATIAKALVALIVKEVEHTKQKNYGYTAQQIVKKVESDPSVMPILPHLLAGLHRAELERLILNVLPDRYLSLGCDDGDEVSFKTLENLPKCFRFALDAADSATRTKFAKKLVSVVKEDDARLVEVYERVLFRGSDLAFLEDSEKEIVKVHLFQQLKDSIAEPLIRACTGISQFLHKKETHRVFHPLLIAAASDRPAGVSLPAVEMITSEYRTLSPQGQEYVRTTLEEFVQFYQRRSNSAALSRLRPLEEQLLGTSFFQEDDIPF